MNYTIVVLIAVLAALAALKWLVMSSVKRDAGSRKTDRTEYRISPFVYAALATNLILGALFILWGFQSVGRGGAPIAFKTVGGFAVTFALAASWWYSACRIELNDTRVVICSPSGTKEVLFECLKEVRVSNGMIVLDEGRIPRTVIPIIYRQSSELLGNIRARMEIVHSGS